jgi:hypothetical protein
MQRLAVSELQKQALWLVGVLMGIAIKEAMTNIHAVFVSHFELLDWLLGAVPLLLFFLVSLRFYLSAIQYFTVAFESSAPASELRRQRFSVDLIFGFAHVAFVCFWGLSIALFDGRWPVFPGLLITILLCDVLWYAWAVSDTRRTIRIRVLVNAVTGGWATLAFGATALAFMCFANGWQVELTQSQGALCEAVAYVPVCIASVVELGALSNGRGVEEWLGEALSRPEVHQG